MKQSNIAYVFINVAVSIWQSVMFKTKCDLLSQRPGPGPGCRVRWDPILSSFRQWSWFRFNHFDLLISSCDCSVQRGRGPGRPIRACIWASVSCPSPVWVHTHLKDWLPTPGTWVYDELLILLRMLKSAVLWPWMHHTVGHFIMSQQLNILFHFLFVTGWQMAAQHWLQLETLPGQSSSNTWRDTAAPVDRWEQLSVNVLSVFPFRTNWKHHHFHHVV